jgi:hypothetical protein
MTRCALGIDASVERSECGLAFKRRSRRRKDALFCDLRRAFSRQRPRPRAARPQASNGDATIRPARRAGLAVARRVDGCEDDVRLRRLRGFGETAFALDPERRPVRKRGFARSTRAESLGSDQATHVSPERRLNVPEKKLQGFGPRTEPEEPRALPGYSAPHTFPTLRGLRQANRFGRLRANRR